MPKNKKTFTLIFIATSVVLVEWSEYALYLYLGSTIAPNFFPSNDPQIQNIMVFSVFALAYITRPIGGAIFGYLADKRGRKVPMLITCTLMGAATLFIGLLPGYNVIGIASPILLLLLRMLQSISVSGELNNASIYIMEQSDQNKTFYGCWIAVAASAGLCIGGFVANQVLKSPSPEAWRFAFISMGLLSFIIMLARKNIVETPVFLRMKNLNLLSSNPLIQSIKKHPYTLVKIGVIASFVSVYVYICSFYFVSYLIHHSSMSHETAIMIASFSQLFTAILIPFIALLADKIGYLKVFLFNVILMCLCAPLLFYSPLTSGYLLLGVSILMFVIADAGISSTVFRLMFEMLPSNVRCTGISTIWGLSAAIFGATSPIVSDIFVLNGYFLIPGLYVSCLGFLAIVLLSKNNNLVLKEPQAQKTL